MLLKFDPLMTKTVARHKPDSRLMASRVNAALSTPSIAAFMVQIEFTAPAYQFELVMSENILSPSAERTTLRKVTPCTKNNNMVLRKPYRKPCDDSPWFKKHMTIEISRCKLVAEHFCDVLHVQSIYLVVPESDAVHNVRYSEPFRPD
jgi:hypothetical protein